ncbi:MAG: DUF4476 domain-containing protein [Proteobacteria bacterium]|nr:DUF4476 domain-containing protein [Pseudomonadota bacterium]
MMKSKSVFAALVALAFASVSCAFFSSSPDAYTSAGYQESYQEPYYGEQTVVTSSAGGTYGVAEAGPYGSSATVVGPDGEVISVSVSISGTGMMDTQIYDSGFQQQTVVTHHGGGGHQHGGGGGGGRGGCYAMGIVDFGKYYDTMKAKSFDEHKVDLAKMSAKSGACFSTDQIVKLLGLLTFDNKKEEMAVILYPITSDKQNWFQLSNAFTHQMHWQNVVEQTVGD